MTTKRRQLTAEDVRRERDQRVREYKRALSDAIDDAIERWDWPTLRRVGRALLEGKTVGERRADVLRLVNAYIPDLRLAVQNGDIDDEESAADGVAVFIDVLAERDARYGELTREQVLAVARSRTNVEAPGMAARLTCMCGAFGDHDEKKSRALFEQEHRVIPRETSRGKRNRPPRR